MRNNNPDKLRVAIPSKGRLGDNALSFFAKAGLKIDAPNERQYVARIPAIPEAEVVFQRPKDIVTKISDGTADIGVTGYDIIQELAGGDTNIVFIQPLGFARCRLVLAVPDSWIDVTSLADLADLAAEYKNQGKALRIVTGYQNLAKTWLYDKNLTNFQMVHAHGALEAAPRMGYADMIADITQTGTTLRENRLKEVDGGTILKSEAWLIGNLHSLRQKHLLRTTRHIIEFIEANLRARQYVTILANIQGQTQDEVGRRLLSAPKYAGLVGPSIRPITAINSQDVNWYEISVVVARQDILATVDHLRSIGGRGITVTDPTYIFEAESETYKDLLTKL